MYSYGDSKGPKSSQGGGSLEQRPYPEHFQGFILLERSGSRVSDRKYMTAMTTINWAWEGGLKSPLRYSEGKKCRKSHLHNTTEVAVLGQCFSSNV